MKICNWLLISLFLILCLSPLLAQYTYHTSDSSLIYTEQVKGLEDIYDRKVGKSFCDSNQTIWLASQGGLFRFDGSFLERIDIPLDFSAGAFLIGFILAWMIWGSRFRNYKKFMAQKELALSETKIEDMRQTLAERERVIEELGVKLKALKHNQNLGIENLTDSELPTIQLSEGLPLADKEFLESLDKLIEENISRLEFTIEDLSYSLAISSRQLRRKIQKLSGLTPNQYIRKYKMNVARELLESRSIYSVKELSYKLGFKSSAHFAKLFKNHFGRNPSDFV